MKKLFLATLILFFTCLPAYGDTEVVGGAGGVAEGADVVFGTISGGDVTVNSITAGSGKTLLFPILDNATGNETALSLDYVINKAAGNDTGIAINMTDTASPGGSNFISASVDGVPKFVVTANGALTANAAVITAYVEARTNGLPLRMKSRAVTTAMNGVELQDRNITNSTGNVNAVAVLPNYEQTGDATANALAILPVYSSVGTGVSTDLLINRTENSTGSGDQLLIDAQVDDVSMFSVNTEGTINNAGGVVFGGMTTIRGTYSSPSNIYAILADASSAPFQITLPDTSTVPYGFQHRTKKIDDSDNAITVDGFGSQTIDHSLTKIIRAHNNAITLVSDGSNWEVMQFTSTGFYGDMHVHDNISTTTIQTQNSPHLIRQFSEEITFGMSFHSGSIGPISAFTEYSTVVPGTTQVTDDAHGLTSGDIITINGTTSYNGIFEATVIDAANYYIVDTFVADDATGTWVEGDYFEMNVGTAGIYMLSFHGYGKPDAGTNQDYEFEIFVNTVPQENVEAKRRFANASDIGTFGGGGLATLADGDRIAVGIFSESGTQDFTLTHLNIALHLIRAN